MKGPGIPACAGMTVEGAEVAFVSGPTAGMLGDDGAGGGMAGRIKPPVRKRCPGIVNLVLSTYTDLCHALNRIKLAIPSSCPDLRYALNRVALVIPLLRQGRRRGRWCGILGGRPGFVAIWGPMMDADGGCRKRGGLR